MLQIAAIDIALGLKTKPMEDKINELRQDDQEHRRQARTTFSDSESTTSKL